MTHTPAASLIANMPTKDTLTEQVKKTLVDVFGKWDARSLATQHPAALIVELQGKIWGSNLLEIIVAMQNHLEQTLQGTLINFVTWELVKEGETDKFGMNLVFSQLPELIIRAGLWAVLTKHTYAFWANSLVRQQDYLAQLFQEKLPAGMGTIIADFERALAHGDPVALDTTALMTNEKAVALFVRGGGEIRRPTWSEPDYEALVRKNTESAPRKDLEGNDLAISERVYSHLSINGTGNVVTACIVIDSCKIAGNSNIFNVIMPPGGTCEDNGTGTHVRVRNWPWKTIAEELGLVR